MTSSASEDVPESPGAPPARPLASALRSAAFRSILFAVALFSAVCAFLEIGTLIMGDGPPFSDPTFWLGLTFSSGVLGLVAAPVSFVEVYAASRARSRARDAVAGLLAGVLALAGAVLAATQGAYTVGVFRKHGGHEGGVKALTEWLQLLATEPAAIAALALVAAPFVPATIARVRGLSLGRAVLATVAGGGLLSLPTIVWIFHDTVQRERELAYVFVGAVLAFDAALPLVLHVADAIERRVGEILARAED